MKTREIERDKVNTKLTPNVMTLNKAYLKGTRVMPDYTDDPFTELTSGDTGTVSSTSGRLIGTLFIPWDHGSGLGLDYHADSHHRIS